MLQRIYAYSCMYLFKLVFSSSLNKFPEVKMLYHILVLFLIFWGNWILYSIVAAPVYIPSMQGFPFLHILTKTCHYFWLFDSSHSDRYEVISRYGFTLHFPDDRWCCASFHVPIDHLYIFFWKWSIQIPCPFFN